MAALSPVAIVIPARNEAANLDACLAAAVDTGAAEIWVADDNSTDATPRIAATWAARDPRIRTLAVPAPPAEWAGKNHALWVAAQQAQSPWLLFLDADTRLLPGALDRALTLATASGLAALSVSPEQETGSWAERAVLPRIFDLLDRRYPMARVNDAADACAAGNGQFFLIQRDAYFRLGGHAAIAGEWLEDVGLARRIKAAGLAYRFLDGRGFARTRMYHGFGELWAGWSKNMVALFGPPRLAAVAPLAAPLVYLAAVVAAGAARRPGWAAVAALLLLDGHLRYARRLHRAGRGGAAWLLAANAILIGLWWRAAWRRRWGRPAQWKGRVAPRPRAMP